jgi:hypothetical protein
MIAAIENRLPPAALVQIPLHRLSRSRSRSSRRPASQARSPSWWRQSHSADHGPGGRRQTQSGPVAASLGGWQRAEQIRDGVQHMQVGTFVAPANVVGHADTPALHYLSATRDLPHKAIAEVMNSGPMLSIGSTGSDVRRLQVLFVMMKEMDFSDIDGNFGPKTLELVKDFSTRKQFCS